MTTTKIKALAELMKYSSNTVVLTGAGMDTESNIPDFRSQQGWWKNIDPRTVANIDAFFKDYSLFQEFYSIRLSLLENCKPHKGHYVLADLMKKGLIQRIATQNVSGFHRMAGADEVFELHGNIRKIRCNSCDADASLEAFIEKQNCKYCGEQALRPGVVLFGEMLPTEEWNQTLMEIEQCDLLIVMGTSLEVYPVNQIPLMAKGKTVYINNEDIGKDYGFDLTIIGKAKEVLEELYDALD
ncbi:NAD-dependent deacetylase [Natronincola peptidivorans]|uniref:protein acetyllysine N-acetyltransferase n=1 Tax=Natronincola peptidivorans TaxID=426128 RepID=A0A1I0BG65_9FIRM|nr:NAD-dependent deacylase [Natronincola peptidivorans]SET05884.1 NAD-dependent deacetylase [Natronincola peptidivorans]